MRYIVFSFLFFFTTDIFSQSINPENITIVRDSFGVPHIYAPTDAEVAYGLAYAHCEDDFKNIQYNGMPSKGLLGGEIGKEGVLFDFALQFLNIDKTVHEKYENDISEDYKKIIEAYVQGVNDYAKANPKEVLNKNLFPVTAKDLLKGSILQTSLMGGVGLALKAINDGKIEEFYQINDIGSNAIAIAGSHTDDGKTYLCGNSHQPLEGRFAWYEAHLVSDEGWDIIGGLFPGGTTIFVGTTKDLGWSHTVNYHNFGDIFKVKVNPKNKKQYELDGQWKDFEERKIKLKVKIAGIKIPVSRKVLYTAHGPTLKGKDKELYAIRFEAYNNIKATEQWYKMNKAKNFEEFENALKLQDIPLFNVIYADKEGNILLHSGGTVPDRDPSLDWNNPITSTSSKYLWTDIVSYDRMPTVTNPDCGFVYNCNNSPLFCTGDECEWPGNFIGVQTFNFNRGERFKYLLEKQEGKYSFDDMLKVKFDKSYHHDSSASYLSHFKHLYELDENKYADISDAIKHIKKWNLDGDVNNKHAALALVSHDFLVKKKNMPFGFFMLSEKGITEEDAVDALRFSKKFLIKKHGSIDIPLGQVQRHIRGDVSIPASGLREVGRAADARLVDKKKGIFRVESGDGYMQMVKFSENADPELKSINAYGASSKPESPHYTDQMEMFQKEEFKEMTFDKAEIFKNAKRIYKPGE